MLSPSLAIGRRGPPSGALQGPSGALAAVAGLGAAGFAALLVAHVVRRASLVR
jgi:hypothetical protein